MLLHSPKPPNLPSNLRERPPFHEGATPSKRRRPRRRRDRPRERRRAARVGAFDDGKDEHVGQRRKTRRQIAIRERVFDRRKGRRELRGKRGVEWRITITASLQGEGAFGRRQRRQRGAGALHLRSGARTDGCQSDASLCASTARRRPAAEGLRLCLCAVCSAARSARRCL